MSSHLGVEVQRQRVLGVGSRGWREALDDEAMRR